MRKASRYSVIVGNIGTVITTDVYEDALHAWGEYRRMSITGVGRGAGEDVVLFDGDTIRLSYEIDVDGDGDALVGPTDRVAALCSMTRARLRDTLDYAIRGMMQAIRVELGVGGGDVNAYLTSQGEQHVALGDDTWIKFNNGRLQLCARPDHPMTATAYRFTDRTPSMQTLVLHAEAMLRMARDLSALRGLYAP